MDASDAMDDAADAEMDAADDDDPAMRNMAYNRTDENAHKNTKSKKDGDDGHDATEDKDKAKGKYGDGSMKKEELELEVIDDEALTEAVLKRVVERLLKKN